MADSPLAQIDWENLENHSLITAVNLLQHTFEERMKIASLINRNHLLPTLTGSYPFRDIQGQIGNIGGPFIWRNMFMGSENFTNFGAPRDDVMSEIDAEAYAGHSMTQSRLFARHGVTEWPTFDTVNSTDIKKLYDMITDLKSIAIQDERQVDVNIHNALRQEWQGATDPSFQTAPDTATYNALWTGPESKADAGDNATSALTHFFYQGGGTLEQITAYKVFYVLNRQPLIDSGHLGVPQFVDAYGTIQSRAFSTSGGIEAGLEAWLDDAGFPVTDDDKWEYFDTDVVATNGEVEYSSDIPPPSPSLPPVGGIGATSTVTLDRGRNLGLVEYWDYEGGFEFYTPVP